MPEAPPAVSTQVSMNAGSQVWDGGPQRPVGLPAELFRWQRWSGALAVNGRLVAFLVESEQELSLLAREADGAFATAWERERWRDNDECIRGAGPLGFRGPCEP